MVSIRLALLGVIGGIAAGLLGGWGLAHSWQAGPWMPVSSPGQPSLSADANAALARIDRGGNDGATDGLSLVVVDRSGKVQKRIAANRPWTPRFSPDGRRVAYGAYGEGRTTSDVWVTDLDAGTTQRLTDDDGDSNDPQWSPDGKTVAYSVNAPGGKDIASRALAGGAARMLASRNGTQFPSDWLRDDKALLVTDDGAGGGHDIIVQPADGSPARSYVATRADETTARASPDGRWIAYTSDASGSQEVYLDSYPRPGHRVQVSQGGGSEPVWRGDGRELYYWRGDALVAVQLGAANGEAPPSLGTETVLFRTPFQSGLNTMYDASPDGQRFVIVARQ